MGVQSDPGRRGPDEKNACEQPRTEDREHRNVTANQNNRAANKNGSFSTIRSRMTSTEENTSRKPLDNKGSFRDRHPAPTLLACDLKSG